MIEFSQNKPRALHVDKLMCSGLLLLFLPQELLCDFNQNHSVKGNMGMGMMTLSLSSYFQQLFTE